MRSLIIFGLLVCHHFHVNAELMSAPDWNAAEQAFDAYFAQHLPQYHVPGGVLVVVQGETIRIAKGYGHARLEAERTVDAGDTLFRIGSVSKLLTATAVMQCVEQGLLDLHRDINDYLTVFKVPDTYPEPITLHHLLTHTAGFDDRFLELGVMNPDDLEPLGEYLARRLPSRVQPPDEIYNYSNFGIVLAAHLVEVVTGEPFAQYVDAHICTPLGMAAGGFDQPLPPELAARLAHSYVVEDDAFEEAPWQDAASQVWPSGAYAATATDMAKFMMAHLHQGRYGNAQILRPETMAQMHARQFINHPGLTRGQCYGFHERIRNDKRILWHTGRVNRFTAQLVLVPELDLGFFAAFNSDEGDQTRTPLFELFVDQFFPGPQPQPVTPSVLYPGPFAPFAGMYRQVRSVRSTFLKIAFFGQDVVLRGEAGGPLLGGDDLWEPVEADVYRAVHGWSPAEERHMAFVRDASGYAQYVCMEEDNFSSVDAYKRLAWYETSLFHMLVVVPSLVLLISMLARAPFVLRRFRTRPYAERLCAVMAAFAALCLVAFAGGLGLTIALMDPYRFAFGLPPVVLGLLALPLLALPCVGGLAVGVAMLVRSGGSTRWGRVHYVAVCLAGVAVVWSLNYWNLIGYRM